MAVEPPSCSSTEESLDLDLDQNLLFVQEAGRPVLRTLGQQVGGGGAGAVVGQLTVAVGWVGGVGATITEAAACRRSRQIAGSKNLQRHQRISWVSPTLSQATPSPPLRLRPLQPSTPRTLAADPTTHNQHIISLTTAWSN